MASLNLGSVNVAVSTDDGNTFSQTPVQAGLPLDDREWIAAYGADTSLLSYHGIGTSNIDVLRSGNGGALYTQIARVIPDTDYKAADNELGNLVIDHRNTAPVAGDFWAYQSFAAPSSASNFLHFCPEGFDAWIHFSAIEMDGFRDLEAGDLVEFDYEEAQQDSFRFRATRVRKL